jgi:tRNA-splicing ligase RtcB (3'-phosphate/5'-hydroxy nucleic acid ligase)
MNASMDEFFTQKQRLGNPTEENTMTDSTYNVIMPDKGVPIKAWTKGVPLEDAARQQLLNVAQLPFIYKWVAAMPDVHWGIGATVGSVIPTRGAIIPAAVGVDIGCGMMAVQTSLHANHLPDNLHGIRTAIEKAVPHGRTDNGGKNDRGAWSDAPEHHAEVWAKMEPEYNAIVEKYPKLNHVQRINHMGTLGTGNHFIEVCLDENENVWFLLHSGSRGVGNRFGTFFIELAKNDMRQWMINLPDKDLAYLPQGTEHFEDYVARGALGSGLRAGQPRTDDAQSDRGRTGFGRGAGVRSQCGSCQLPSQLRDLGAPLRRERTHHAQGSSACT